ncbi:indole-3-glycerol phosphate synthase-domain-containing protein [Kickxella alabastrina]|uniref:indole-3-glycerol phosphate synthase-domain-containing protein n=1 Tax=Kickxella alabastrina TaxID=61397 RepID=UPI00221E7276|nr:indole-3-glycerol phosphate synthase-domain-containing protein [Kickxella alabastrina]KAI7830873.1 indole-3-glycerol phosphate synthase-domain-containing protein [Kickxella alabastrina]
MATILLDAYDSFTFNLYQYLRKAGASDVQVYRNDKITLAEVIALNPRNIVLSPGPGHPREDPGICYEVLSHFQGKIPILGICLGQQMMYEHYGGTVGYAGEIQHGKTGLITHDAQGLYRGLKGQAFPVTSWTPNGIIMGVRHKVYAMEGVQYHPESILSENGLEMFRNFLALQGGTWEENPGYRDDILTTIFKQRQLDVAQQKLVPGRSMASLQQMLSLGLCPPPMDFAQRLLDATRGDSRLAVLAEIKRASPSKGDISVDAVAAEHALGYARAGAAAISVLTEPTWFKGHLDDLRDVRQAMDVFASGQDNNEGRRPAVLRKEFIFDPYQIAEARLAGADSVLLILGTLIAYSRELGMEPLVEVNDKREMDVALAADARVIGVNNRNLRTFDVDINTTRVLADSGGIPKIGIMHPRDAAIYAESGVRAVLVGEALMRADDKRAFIDGLAKTH